MLKYLVPAAFAAFVGASPAAALSVTAPSGLNQATDSMVHQAQAQRRAAPRRAAPRRAAPRRAAPRRAAPRRAAPRRYGPRRYAPGARLRTAPRGWRRYSARPAYWRTRGCVVVGPLWFCP